MELPDKNKPAYRKKAKVSLSVKTDIGFESNQTGVLEGGRDKKTGPDLTQIINLNRITFLARNAQINQP